jgi:hypothetical protein
MLETYSVILDFIFHNIILYLYWSGSFTRLVVVSIEYCMLVVTVHLAINLAYMVDDTTIDCLELLQEIAPSCESERVS